MLSRFFTVCWLGFWPSSIHQKDLISSRAFQVFGVNRHFSFQDPCNTGAFQALLYMSVATVHLGIVQRGDKY
jgi:hypothetical protein